MNVSLLVIFLVLFLSIYLGISAKKGKDMNLEQWTVGGRGFGALFVFLLMAGEAYTTFTLLGGSGWAYGRGGAALYILGYLSLGYITVYLLAPAIWKYAKENNLMSQSDFFASKYKSPYLGILVAVIGVVSMIPYIVIQLKGLGIIVSEASYGVISPTAAIWIGAISVTVYVMVSGIHGSAWTAVIKDLMVFGVVVFIGIYIPFHYFGGIEPMFKAIHQKNPTFLMVPEQGLNMSWLISSVLLAALTSVMWPHMFSALYTAKNAKALRKNAIISPLYTMMVLFAFFVGFAAILTIPRLKGAEADLALLRLSIQTFDPWFVGIIGAAGLLTALVPGSVLLMTVSASLAKNVYKTMVPSASDQQVTRLAKYLVPLISLLCVYFTLNGGSTIVTLQLMGVSLVTQLLPTLLFSFLKNNFVTKQGAAIGIIVGVITVAYITISKTTMGTLFPFLPQVVQDLNVGFVALTLNILATIVVSLLTKNLSLQSRMEEEVQSTS